MPPFKAPLRLIALPSSTFFLALSLAFAGVSLVFTFCGFANLGTEHAENKIIKKKMNFTYDPELIAEHQYTIHGNTWKGIA